MAYGEFKELTRKTASDKILRDKAFSKKHCAVNFINNLNREEVVGTLYEKNTKKQVKKSLEKVIYYI